MGLKQNPSRDRAFALYVESGGRRALTDIAAEIGVSPRDIYNWKKRDGWAQRLHAARDNAGAAGETQVGDAGKSAPGSSSANGMKKRKAPQTSAGAKPKAPAAQTGQLGKAHLPGAQDVVELHMRIAFADMTDFARWGRTTVPVLGPDGPVVIRDGETGEETPLTHEVNELRLVDSALIDGQIVGEVRVNKDSASIKLADRQRSLAFLERYFELNPLDKHRVVYDRARLAIEERKADRQFPPEDETATGVIALAEVLEEE